MQLRLNRGRLPVVIDDFKIRQYGRDVRIQLVVGLPSCSRLACFGGALRLGRFHSDRTQRKYVCMPTHALAGYYMQDSVLSGDPTMEHF
jgi:hypothetical protein